MEHISRLTAEDSRMRNAAVDAVLERRKQEVEALVRLAEGKDAAARSTETRAAAVYLLGQLRAVEAVPVLARLLAEDFGEEDRSDVSRFDSPVWTALVEIGRPAVPAMLDHVQNSTDERLRKKSLDVLYHVLGGKRRVLETLQRVETRAKDAPIADRVKKAAEWARGHYKEDEEPLY